MSVVWSTVAEHAILLFEAMFSYLIIVVRYTMQASGLGVYGEFSGSHYGAVFLLIIATTFIIPIIVLGIQKIIKKVIYGGLNGFLLFNR